MAIMAEIYRGRMMDIFMAVSTAKTYQLKFGKTSENEIFPDRYYLCGMDVLMPDDWSDVMTHEIIKYRCDHCDREYASKRGALQHEDKCFHLPKNRACITCSHFIAFLEDDIHWLEGGEDVCLSGGYSVECDIGLDIESAGMENDAIIHTPRSHCDGWKERSIIGTYRYGKMMIERCDD